MFACIPSAPSGAFGVGCQNSIGTATCADGLACDAVMGQSEGPRCTYYCDLSGQEPCPPQYQCRSTHVGGAGGPAIQVCRYGTDDGGAVPHDDGGVQSDAPYVEDATLGDSAPDTAPSNQ